MKICKEMIGKRIASPTWAMDDWIKIEWVDGDKYAGITKNGNYHTGHSTFSDFEILEEEKLPSQRIQEIYNSLMISHGCNSSCQTCRLVERTSIIEYLDEKFKKKCT